MRKFLRWSKFWQRYCYVCGEPARKTYGRWVCDQHVMNALWRSRGMCECGWSAGSHKGEGCK